MILVEENSLLLLSLLNCQIIFATVAIGIVLALSLVVPYIAATSGALLSVSLYREPHYGAGSYYKRFRNLD